MLSRLLGMMALTFLTCGADQREDYHPSYMDQVQSCALFYFKGEPFVPSLLWFKYINAIKKHLHFLLFKLQA